MRFILILFILSLGVAGCGNKKDSSSSSKATNQYSAQNLCKLQAVAEITALLYAVLIPEMNRNNQGLIEDYSKCRTQDLACLANAISNFTGVTYAQNLSYEERSVSHELNAYWKCSSADVNCLLDASAQFLYSVYAKDMDYMERYNSTVLQEFSGLGSDDVSLLTSINGYADAILKKNMEPWKYGMQNAVRAFGACK